MSKSAGNGIDPLDMIEKYGTDALRLTLSVGNTPGNDLKFDEANVEHNMIFINKLWNASRFVSTNLTDIASFDRKKVESNLIANYDELMLHEKWILSRIKHLSDRVTDAMEKYDFSDAGQELQIFTKNEFCDYYIEEFKLTKEESKHSQEVISYVIQTLLKLWHPYIPYVTSEIYTKIGFTDELMLSEWGTVTIERNEPIEKDKRLIMDIIKEIRSLRADNNIMPNKNIGLKIYALNKNAEIINSVLSLIAGIVKADSFELIDKKPTDDNYAYGVIKA
jgi:valyl-tRNA synthetase